MALQKFASQADQSLLKAVKEIANKEGKQFQSVIDEALRDFVEKKKGVAPRAHVMTAFGKSLSEFESLYKELAK